MEAPRIAVVCDKWDLPILPGKETVVVGGAHNYFFYLNNHMWEIGRNVRCIEHLISRIPKGLTILELGGLGVWATCAQGLLEPKAHVLFDVDDDCLAQLHAAFDSKPGVSVVRGDITELIDQYPSQFYLMDIPNSTIVKHSNWVPLWKKMVATSPQYILFQDGASKYLHLHRETYSRAFGTPITDHASYIHAMSKFLQSHYGYGVRAATWSSGCYYMLVTPEPTEMSVENDIEITKAKPEWRDGLRWK
jgi:hypothetical protein